MTTVKFSELPVGERFTCLFVVYKKVDANHAVAGYGDGVKQRLVDPGCQCDISPHRFDSLGLEEEVSHANGPYPEGSLGEGNEPNIAMVMMDWQGDFIYVWRIRPPAYEPNQHWAGLDYKPRLDNHLMGAKNKRLPFPDGRESALMSGDTWRQSYGKIPAWLERGRVFLVRYEYLSGKAPERILKDPICTCA